MWGIDLKEFQNYWYVLNTSRNGTNFYVSMVTAQLRQFARHQNKTLHVCGRGLVEVGGGSLHSHMECFGFIHVLCVHSTNYTLPLKSCLYKSFTVTVLTEQYCQIKSSCS